jgi:hypothetical protein
LDETTGTRDETTGTRDETNETTQPPAGRPFDMGDGGPDSISGDVTATSAPVAASPPVSAGDAAFAATSREIARRLFH